MSAELCTLKRTLATETPEKSQRLQLLRERQRERLEVRIYAVISEYGGVLDDIDEVEDDGSRVIGSSRSIE